MEPLICAAAPDADADEDEWEDVPEGEEGDGEWDVSQGVVVCQSSGGQCDG